MKRQLAFVLGIILATLMLKANDPARNDTTVRFKNKTILIEDSIGQMKVNIFDNDSTPYKKVYEGIFSDGKSYEKWTVVEEIGLNIPIFNKMITHKKRRDYSMNAHWAGIGWGFANVADKDLNINDINKVSLKSQSSNEFYLNLIEHIVPLYRNNIGLTTGFGMGWHNYFFRGKCRLAKNDDGDVIVKNDIDYGYNRLRTYQLTVPLLLEWQPTFQSNRKFYLSAGLVGCFNVYTSYKYSDPTRDNVKRSDKDMNVRPLSVDVMVQGGYGDFGLFAKYSPCSLFESGKGPDVRGVSFGATLNF